MFGLRTLAFFAVASCYLGSSTVDATAPKNLRREALSRDYDGSVRSYYQSAERFFFSEVLSGEDKEVVLEAGPFKIEASCKTIVQDYGGYYSYMSHYNYNSTMMPYHMSHYNFNSTMTPYHYGPYYDDSMGYSYTEHFAALDLTFTATTSDYVYGLPNYNFFYYSDDSTELLVGAYEAGESRNATVFRGYDGGYGDNVALRTMSGYYIGIPSSEAIGIHRYSATWLPEGNATFPDGVDCMVSGFINYVSPTKK